MGWTSGHRRCAEPMAGYCGGETNTWLSAICRFVAGSGDFW